MKKFLLFIFFFLVVPNVYAYDYNLSSSITSPTAGSSTGGRYEFTELNGATNTGSIGTTYNGTIQNVRFNLPVPNSYNNGCFWTNMTYKVTMNMADNDWRNRFGTVKVSESFSSSTNWSSGSVIFVSMKKIYFTFKIPSSYTTCVQFVTVNLPSNALFTPFTGDTNWTLSSVILSDELSSSGGGSTGGGSTGGGSTGGGSTGATNEDIINNQNQNNNALINNQNQNTSDIIENNNQNTQTIIDSQKVCRFIDKGFVKFDNGYLNSSGSFVADSSAQWGVTDYINVTGATITVQDAMISSAYTCFYNANKVLTGCSSQANFTVGSSPNVPTSSAYVRFSIYKTLNIPTFNICTNGSQSVDNSIQEVNSSINSVNDSINNSNVDNGVGEGFFDNFSSQDFGLSQIITIPLNTIQGLTSKSCLPLQVPIPFTNSNVNLPCMTEIYTTKFSTIYNLWKIVSFGIIAYLIAIDIFHIVKGFKDPESDKVEVLDL